METDSMPDAQKSASQEAFEELYEALFVEREIRALLRARRNIEIRNVGADLDLAPFAAALEGADDLKFEITPGLRLASLLLEDRRAPGAQATLDAMTASAANQPKNWHDKLVAHLVREPGQISEALKWLPDLAQSRELAEGLSKDPDRINKVSRSDLPTFERLRGDETGARNLLQGAIYHAPGDKAVLAQVLKIAAAWSDSSPWVGLMSALVLNAGLDDTEEHENAAARLKPLVRHLRQLPLVFEHGERELSLDQSSPEVRAAWRRSVLDLTADDPALQAAAIEAILWLTRERSDDDTLLLVAELANSSSGRRTLTTLRHHPALKVSIRASTVLNVLDGHANDDRSSGAPTLLQSMARIAPQAALTSSAARTWLGDALIENRIEDAVRLAAEAAARNHEDHHGEDEEALCTDLLKEISQGLRRVGMDTMKIATAGRAKRFLSFTCDYRQVSKTEEGKKDIESGLEFGADVCIIVDSRENGRTFSKRATLVQAKKLYREASRWDRSYKIDSEQLDALVRQTSSSFYLFIGPEEAGRAIPCMPARLLQEIKNREGHSGTIRRELVGDASKGLAEWFLRDVIGLWTGDPSDALVAKAEGGDGRRPRAFLSLVIDITDKPRD